MERATHKHRSREYLLVTVLLGARAGHVMDDDCLPSLFMRTYESTPMCNGSRTAPDLLGHPTRLGGGGGAYIQQH